MPRDHSPRARKRVGESVQACVRVLYEDTLVPVREIARLAGITERNLYLMVRRLGCRPRMRLASGGGRRIVPLAAAGKAARGEPLDAEGVQRAIEACARAVQHRHEEAAVKQAASQQLLARKRTRREADTNLRTLTYLMRALRDLSALNVRAAAVRQAAPREPPTDVEELRASLSRRIDALIAQDKDQEQDLERAQGG